MDILCFTPGLDSFLADNILKEQGKEYKRVYINLNGMYSYNELEFMESIYDEDYFDIIHNLNINNFENKESAHVPNRNLLITTLISSKYNADNIYLNGVLDDRVSDQGNNFYKLNSEILSMTSGKKVEVKSILINREKTDLCKDYVELYGIEKGIDLVTQTLSCFSNEWRFNDIDIYVKENNKYKLFKKDFMIGCGICPACFRKLSALSGSNIYVEFKNYEMILKYLGSVDKNEFPSRYESVRKYTEFNNWVKNINM